MEKIEDAFKKEIREKLADLEHEQWKEWTSAIVVSLKGNWWPGNIAKLIDKWRRSWKPYLKLSEKQKDKDRIYADKVIKILTDYEIYPF